MGYNAFIDRAMGDDIQNQHQGALHKGAKVLESGAKNIGGIGLQSFVAGTVTNVADHVEGIVNPLVDNFREIGGIAKQDSKLKNTARFALLHLPMSVVDSSVATAKSVVGVPAKFMMRFPLRWYRDYANSNVGADYDGMKGFWKTLTTASVPVTAGLLTAEGLAAPVTTTLACSGGPATVSSVVGTGATSMGCGVGATGGALTISAGASTSLGAFAAANPLAATMVGSAAVAPVADGVASGVSRLISNMRTSDIVSNRSNEKKNWYSDTAVYGKESA